MELRFREAAKPDLPALVALLVDDDLAGDRDDTDLSLLPIYTRALEEIAAQAGNRVIVAETEIAGHLRLIACAQFAVIPGLARKGMRRAQLEHVRVASDMRGMGVGRRLLAYLIELARAEECGMVQLTADVARSDAHRFYESHGFVGSHKGFKLLL